MTESGPIRLLVVDDDALVRSGLRIMLGGADDIDVVGDIDDGVEVAPALAQLKPDVILMDIRMPVMDGISATRAVRSQAGQTAQVIVLTTFDADETVVEALRAGAAGFLLKHTPPESIIDAIRRAHAGEPVLSPEVTRTLIGRLTDESPHTTPTDTATETFGQLTDREQAVAQAVAEGSSNADIAEKLYMSVGTVKAHLSSSMTKLGFHSRIQLAILAHDATKK